MIINNSSISKKWLAGIDIIANSDKDRETILNAFGEQKDLIHFVEENQEQSIKLQILTVSENAELPFKDKFVLQEHKIGQRVHYDLRFGHGKQNRFWGYTLFKPFPVDTTKVRSIEKEYGDIKWMTVDGDLKPKSPGNPTSKKSYMKIIDKGTFELVRREKNFTEFILKDGKNKGRYYISTVNVKVKPVEGGEDDKPRNDKLTLIWKAKEQEMNSHEYYNGGYPEFKIKKFGNHNILT